MMPKVDMGKLERTPAAAAQLSRAALAWLTDGAYGGRPPAGMCEGTDRQVLVALEARDARAIRAIVDAHRTELDAHIVRHRPARTWTRGGKAFYYFELF
jgi:hypothetical protein